MITINDALSDYENFRNRCDNFQYNGIKSPFDGVFYPDIAEIPDDIEQEVKNIIKTTMGFEPNIKTMFLRLSKKGVNAPHQAHTDLSLGEYSLMLYMNRKQDCQGGTSLLQHKETGMIWNPTTSEQEAIWREDTNKPDAWRITDSISMAENKACIFHSGFYHRAEPIGGFGDDNKNGRLVLTAFFSEVA